MTSGSRLAGTAFVLLCVAVLGGCSLLRVGYGQLDTVAAWRADDYFDLDARQKDEFRSRFARLHEWHRHDQLPDYAAFLHEVRRRVERGLVREDVMWVTDGVRARYRALARRGAKDAAALLVTITPQQIETLKRRFERDNRRFAREHRLDGAPEDERRAQVKHAVEQVEDWVGHLTHEQVERISALAAAAPPVARLRHEDRQRRQREFIALLAERGNPDAFAARLREWLLDWEKGRGSQQQRLYAEGWEQRVAFFVAVDRILTPQQRAALARRLQGYADDFTRLAERRGPHTAAQ
jgi:hypothetical protein